jgi:hypothetical protein
MSTLDSNAKTTKGTVLPKPLNVIPPTAAKKSKAHLDTKVDEIESNLKTTKGTFLSKPVHVTPPAAAKKSKAHHLDIDLDVPIQRKRRTDPITNKPISNNKIPLSPTTNINLFPTLTNESDIAIVANASDEETKIPAITTYYLTTEMPPDTPTITIKTPANNNVSPKPPASNKTKKKKMISTFSTTTTTDQKTKFKKYIHPNTPMLRAIVVGDSTVRTTVVFRTEKLDKTSCWCDKRLEDENKDEEGWCRKLGMIPNWNKKNGTTNKCLEYHLDGIKIRVDGGYPVRLFTVIINEPFNLNSIIDKAHLICNTLNDTFKTDKNLIAVDPEKLLWSTEYTTWSDILSLEQTYQLLLHNTGIVPPNQPTQGYFEQFNNIIFEHFENGTFNKELQAILFAPDTVLHEDLLQNIVPETAN